MQSYVPYVCNIASVSAVGQTTLITTEIVHAFVIGNLVRFQIPKEYGMVQLNPMKAYVLDVPATDQILLALDIIGFDSFVIPSPPPTVVLDPAQVIPAGDANSGTLAPGGTLQSLTIPGAYQAIIT